MTDPETKEAAGENPEKNKETKEIQAGTHAEKAEGGTAVHPAHNHENTRQVINRLARAIGHLESIKRMVEDGRDCSDVLIQLAAVKAAINNTGKIILHDHINHCIVDAIESGDAQELEELNKAIDQFIK
ncbi:MAG: metal-sensing transcriptional repressor [Eubacterium sp.]|nr:metal-sensing transcriptional repressor [Eubacterium sp.]